MGCGGSGNIPIPTKASATITACTLFALGCGRLLSLGEDDEPRPPDALPVAGDASAGTGVADASGETVPPDGGSPTADAGAGCAARFCSDFDDGDPAPFEWKRVGPNASDPLFFFGARTDTFVSAPRSFRVRTIPNGGTEQWLEHDFADALTGSIRLVARIDGVDPSGSVQILALNCDTGGDAARVFVYADRSLGIASKASAEMQVPGTLAFGAWTSLRVEFQKTSLASATVESTLVVGTQRSLPVKMDDCAPPLKVRLGATITTPASYDVSFDDVAVDWAP